MDELYLDNIDEFVNDHNKIVTYKWLSLTLGVHVNAAKQMLYHYLDHKRKESSAQLHATYLVSGKFVDNGQTSHRVSVVREEQLEDFKSKMSLIVSVHVYSVQKALLKDSSTLYSVDYDAVKDNLKNCSRHSAIHCSSAVPMSSLELQQVRERQPAPITEPENKKSSMNGETQKPSTKPQKGIMAMFAIKPTSKHPDSSKETKSGQKEVTPEVESTKSKQSGMANPMTNFFATQTTKKPVKTTKEEEAAQSSTTEQKPEQSTQPEENQEAAAVQPPKGTKKDSRSKTKRIEDSDSEEEKMEKKKRRRIKKPEPDSSDEDVIPDSPPQMKTREQPPSPNRESEAVSFSQQVHSEMKTRKRRRVLKHRTFEDEEGCIVTEKVYESESYSETEDDFQPTKQAPKALGTAKLPASHKADEKKSQKKASANANKGTKQASIMGFFQKK